MPTWQNIRVKSRLPPLPRWISWRNSLRGHFLRHIICLGRFFCLRLRNKIFPWMWCLHDVRWSWWWLERWSAARCRRQVPHLVQRHACVCALSSGETEVADVAGSASDEVERTKLRTTADQQAAGCCGWQTDWTQRPMDGHQSTT